MPKMRFSSFQVIWKIGLQEFSDFFLKVKVPQRLKMYFNQFYYYNQFYYFVVFGPKVAQNWPSMKFLSFIKNQYMVLFRFLHEVPAA